MTQEIKQLLSAWEYFYANLPDGEYKGIGEMRQATHRLCEALASHAPSEAKNSIGRNGAAFDMSQQVQPEPSDVIGKAAAQPTRSKQVPELTISDEIRLGVRKLCGHIAECDCQNGIFQAEIEHNDH